MPQQNAVKAAANGRGKFIASFDFYYSLVSSKNIKT
jgi:hypothetical protein